MTLNLIRRRWPLGFSTSQPVIHSSLLMCPSFSPQLIPQLIARLLHKPGDFLLFLDILEMSELERLISLKLASQHWVLLPLHKWSFCLFENGFLGGSWVRNHKHSQSLRGRNVFPYIIGFLSINQQYFTLYIWSLQQRCGASYLPQPIRMGPPGPVRSLPGSQAQARQVLWPGIG